MEYSVNMLTVSAANKSGDGGTLNIVLRIRPETRVESQWSAAATQTFRLH